MLDQGIQLLDRFCQEDRVRIRQPRRNLQIKVVRPISGQNEFVAYIDAIGRLDDRGCLLEWKTTSARYPTEPDGLLALDPQLICYSWITGISEVAQVVSCASGWSRFSTCTPRSRMSSGASSGSWSKPPSGRSSRLSSCPTAASVSRRTRAAAVPISGFVSDGRSWSRPLSSGGQERKVLIGLTSFITKNPPMLPKLNRRRAQFVLTKINEILAWEQRKEVEKDTRFVELGRY